MSLAFSISSCLTCPLLVFPRWQHQKMRAGVVNPPTGTPPVADLDKKLRQRHEHEIMIRNHRSCSTSPKRNNHVDDIVRPERHQFRKNLDSAHQKLEAGLLLSRSRQIRQTNLAKSKNPKVYRPVNAGLSTALHYNFFRLVEGSSMFGDKFKKHLADWASMV